MKRLETPLLAKTAPLLNGIKNDLHLQGQHLHRPRTVKEGYVYWPSEFQNPVAVTLATNAARKSRNSSWGTHSSNLEKTLYELDTRVFKGLNGKRANRDNCCYSARIYGYFQLELASTNPHFHGVIDIRHHRFETVSSLINLHWKSLIPGGTVCIKRANNTEGWASYSMKKVENTKFSDKAQPIIIPTVNVQRDCGMCKDMRSCVRKARTVYK